MRGFSSPASVAILAIYASLCGLMSGCKGKTSPQNGGFQITTGQVYQTADGNFSPPQPVPWVPIAGIWYGPAIGVIPQGTVTTYGNSYDGFPSELNGDPETESGPNGGPAFYYVTNGEATGLWNHRFTFNFYCGQTNLLAVTIDYSTGIPVSTYSYITPQEETFLNSGAEDNCYYYYNGSPGLPPASQRFAIVGQEPQTITLTGQSPISTVYGLPLLYVYDRSDNLVDTITATSVSTDNTQATFPFPSSLSSSAYSLAIVNRTNAGPGYTTAGTNLLSIASSQTIAGNPFGVAAGGLTTSVETCIVVGVGKLARSSCSGSTNYRAFPVVSLYAQGQALVGNSAIGVGANPTAVSVYAGPSVSTVQTSGGATITTVTSGTTRAVVANSGSNTVSILDIYNDVVLSNVAVGNQPVALAVSSNGSTAYVANYADSTVTAVNLSTYTPITTIAVGGHPTSVALTASGVLWVGGAGFLTEINTSSMSVVATESSSRTISALGYTDAYNELIATSSDSSGNVYVDAISPSSVQPGGVYTPVASNAVSTLGTYFNPRIQANVAGFTSTVATSTVPIYSAQPGAPPLVVQDGWAVVSATPTGFSITDASGNIVLVSEKTPSPVAAIAVDTNLNVAYLTMPDSNTLLTVPLPGTGSN